MKHFITHIANATINIRVNNEQTIRERTRNEHARMTCIVQSMLTRLNVSHDDDVDDTIRACIDACETIVKQNHIIA